MNLVHAVDGKKSLPKKKQAQAQVVEDEIEEGEVVGTNIAFEANMVDDVNAISKSKKKKKKKKKAAGEDEEQVNAEEQQIQF